MGTFLFCINLIQLRPMKQNSFDVTGTPYDKIESLRSVPNFVEKIAHWLKLSTISYTPLRDKRDGAYTLAVVWAQSPDFFIEIDSSFRFVSFFSNVVTSTEEQTAEKISNFLGEKKMGLLMLKM